MIGKDDIIKNLEAKLSTFSQGEETQNVGNVQRNTDGVILASGLSRVSIGEEVTVGREKIRGMVIGLDEDYVSIILLGPGTSILEGDEAKATRKMVSINASEDLLGRVIDPLGNPLDGKAQVKPRKNMPIERIAPGVVDREPVNTPLKTGLKAIDGMIPIGRGQRELIIGDRGLGKTAIAVDTIINQSSGWKNKSGGKPVICIYVAIGQKRSTTARVIGKLQETGALEHSIVVAATASDAAALQYIAPYCATSIAEYFMEKGQDVLIVHDDLTKHAWAYRQISLVLKRPAGREAYPGDIFYLHSRLLERSAKMSKQNGGGSITALPIIETQANDISAYIPTNVISITDGQIYLQGDLFNIGMRPAINAGSSVSRVGTTAQTGTMKSVAGTLRLEIAQYNELAAFAQFGSDLDAATLGKLERGKRIIEILKQPQYQPLEEPFEVLSIWAVTRGHLDDIPVEEVGRFEKEYHAFMKRSYKKIIEALGKGEKINDKLEKELEKAILEFKKIFKVDK